MSSTLFATLLRHRIPQYLGIYLGVSWGIVQFIDWLVHRYLLSGYLTDIALVTLVSLVPAAVLVAYTHGAPGRQGWGRAEKVGVPLNLVATAILLAVLFHGKDVGATTEKIVVTDADGQTSERQVPRAAFRRKAALFFWANKNGAAQINWLQYGFPLMLAHDLRQDPFLQISTPYGQGFYSRLQRAGYDDGLNVPVSLQRQIAKDYHLPYFVDGELDAEDGAIRATVTLYRTEPARQVSQRIFTGEDPADLVDRMTLQLKTDLEIPEGSEQLASDLPVAEHLSDSREAIADYVAGLNSQLLASDNEQAVADWQRAVERDPSFALAHLELAETYTGLGRLKDARAALDEALRHEYKLSERYRFVAKGFEYLVKGKFEERTALFEMWTELYPDDVAAYINLAQAYLWWENRLDDAIAAYRKLYEIDPTADWVLRQIAELLKGLGRSEEAIDQIRQYAQLHPDEYVPFLDLGEIYETTGELGKARDHYAKANMLSSRVVTPSISLARIDLKEGKVDKATERLLETQSVAVSPQQESSVVDARLKLLLLRGQIEEAVELLERLAEIESKYRMPIDVMIDVWVSAGDVYVLAGRMDEVIARLEEMSSMIEPPFNGFFDIAFMNVYLAAEDPDQTAAYREKAVEFVDFLDRKDLRVLTEYAEGRIEELRGDYTAAAGAYQRALELYLHSAQHSFGGGRDTIYLTALGRAQRLSGDPEAARESLERALRLFPSYPEAHLELARLYEGQGDTAACRSHLDSALEFWKDADPTYPLARAARTLSGSC